MSDIIRDLRLKVQRAEKHFVDFQNTVFRNPDPRKSLHAPRFQHDPDRKRIIAQAQHVPEPDPEWGIILGDVFHQLRATLDHLIYASVIRPLTTREARDVFLETVLVTDTFAELKLSQPYERNPSAPSSDPLWRLHKLDIIDKHRTILILDNRWELKGGAWDPTGNRPVSFELGGEQPVIPDAQLFEIPWPGPEPPREVYVKRFTANVVFTETGLCDGEPVVTITQDMIAAVTEIIDTFTRQGLI